MKCINKHTVEYEDLKRSSTLSNNMLDAHCLLFQDEHGRMPRLDEIPGSNSSEYLKSELKVNKYNGVSNKRLLDFTGSESVLEAVINLNNHYVDSLVKAIDLGESSLIEIKLRPDNLSKLIENEYIPDIEFGNDVIITGLNNLRELYGYDFKEVSNYELSQELWDNLIPGNKVVGAFIYNGDIYINTDNMTPDSKIHEMLHLLVGSIRFTNPLLYLLLLEQTSKILNIEFLVSYLHPDKTKNDALEEIFVTELANRLTGEPSLLDQLSKELLYEINYNVKRVLDTLLFGDYSSKVISDGRLYNMSFRLVAKEVNSNYLTNTFHGTYNLDGSEVHRKLSNLKQDLLKKKELLEICE